MTEEQSAAAIPPGEHPNGSVESPELDSGNSYEPMSPSTLGRLFGVPFIIIASIVGAAMLVVFLFGAPASIQHRSLDDLLLALESSSGGKKAGMLLPREKEHWQAGLELTARLEKKEAEFGEGELEMVASRVGAMVSSELARFERSTQMSEETGTPGADEDSRRMTFLIRALGLTGRVGAVDVLIDTVRRAPEGHAATAMEQLGNLSSMHDVSAAVDPIIDVLRRSALLESKLVACTVLSVIADGSDSRVLEALESTLLSAADGEVAWSAALALARLGSAAGKSTLMDLLDRSFWEAERTDESGRSVRFRMPPNRVEHAIIAAVDAASNLEEPELWEMIRGLQTDPSSAVRERALAAVAEHDHRS